MFAFYTLSYVWSSFEMFIDVVLDPTLQLTFKELPFVKFRCPIGEYP